MNIVCVVAEVSLAAVIVWRAVAISNRMSMKTHRGIRVGWAVSGAAAGWWAVAALAHDPIRTPLVLTLAGFAVVSFFDRRGGGRHGHA